MSLKGRRRSRRRFPTTRQGELTNHCQATSGLFARNANFSASCPMQRGARRTCANPARFRATPARLSGRFPRDELSVDAAFRHAASRRALSLHPSNARFAILGRQRIASNERVLFVLGLAVIEPAAPRLVECSAGFPQASRPVLVRLAASRTSPALADSAPVRRRVWASAAAALNKAVTPHPEARIAQPVLRPL